MDSEPEEPRGLIVLTSATARSMAATIMQELDAEVIVVDSLAELQELRTGEALEIRAREEIPEPEAELPDYSQRGGKGRGRGRADWNKRNRGCCHHN